MKLERPLLWVVVFALGLVFSGFALAQGASGGGASFNHATTGFILDGAHIRERCESCHVQGSFRGTPRDCALCHRPGGLAPGKPPSHVQTSASCDSCHMSTAWTPANFRHQANQGVVQGGCSTCHNGGSAPGKPLTHPVTGASCDSCHKTAAWLPAGYSHALVTPGTCTTCHNGTRATGKPPSHVPTSASCDACHTAGVAFSPAAMNHSGTAGLCATCHNGSYTAVNALAKPATHIPTTQSCDVCHTTVAWRPTSFSHTGVAPGTCASCHDGSKASGKSVSHIPTTASCDACHTAGVAFAPVSVGMATMHANMLGPVAASNCTTCHSGAYLAVNAQIKPATHLPTTAQCDTCHSSRTTWATGTFDHAAVVPGSCATCHDGTTALGKPTTHIPTAQPCDTCHTNFTAFRPAAMNHVATTGNCSTCHNGSYIYVNALAKPATHIPTTAQCDTCHTNFTAFKPALMNHATTAGTCATCHNGSYTFVNAKAKPTSHIPTTAQCDTCHVSGFLAFSPATMNHAGLNGKCITCHSGGYISQNAQTKPATHIATTSQCDTCHKSTTTWATGTFDHVTAVPAVAGRCSTCHNGASALGKPVTHIPTGAQCDTCHGNFTAFKPATMNHTGLAGQCSTCHNGSYLFANALARPIGHIPTGAQCDTCHVSGFVAWSPATMNHAGLAGLCSACHNGTYLAQNAQTKPATHVSTTAQCDTCHRSTTTWATATYTHTADAVSQCSICHNSVTALGKPSTHIPTTAQCDTCHSGYAAFKPARMNHTGTAGTCATCHNGAYVFANALGRSASHIPTVASCDTCHTGGFAAWSPATMNHAGLTGVCSTCHSGAYLAQNAQTKPATHLVTTAQCDTCHTSTVTWATRAFDHTTASPPAAGRCSTCHNGTSALGKPTNHIPTTAQCDTCHASFAAFAPATMSHSGTTGPVAAGNCSTCHNATYVYANAQVKPATHLVTTAQCDTCHKSTISWASASYTHDATAVGTCATCHNGSTALGKNATHIPTTAQCDTCHTNYTAFKPAKMNHTGTAALCSTCHNGSYTAVNALAKPTSHVPTGAACDTCHNNGFASFMPSPMNHAGTNSPVAAGNCSTCHSGAYLAYNAQVKPATHITTSAQCDTCHASTTTWATGTFNHVTAVPAVAGRCATCHNGTSALGKPSTHIPTTAQCDTCHNTFTAFAPAAMSHAGTTGPVATGNCATCHGGGYTTVNAQAKPATHIPTTQSCDTCHGTVAWKPTTFAHAGVVAGTCATCHNGTTALGKPATHLPTTASCDVCHTNYAAFAPAKMNHAGSTGPLTAGNCATCHSGTYLAINAQVKPATHVATTAQCDTCHKSTTSWATATFVHDATAAGACATCHNGTTALGKPTTHIPTTAQCDTCHTNYTSFRPAAMNHVATAGPAAVGNCATCHGGGYVAVNALAKPTTHIPTTGQCDSCHTRGYTAWSPATMNHTGLTSCTTCHSGAYVAQNAQTKPATHIPTTAQCSTCHSSTTTWATGTFDHATASPAAAGRCSTCHNGSSALGKPSTHIPTTAQCDTCHKVYTAFAPATMDHAGTSGPVAAGNCSSCHSGAYLFANALAKPATHLVTTAQCDTCHKSTISWASASYTHDATAVGTCATCHNGSTALGKNATHIPTTAQCDTCHTNYTAFKPAKMNHTGTAALCSTCHNGSYTAVNALAKPTSHVPTGAACDTCHNNGFASFMPSPMNHAGTNSPVAAGNCSTCHSGAYLAYNAQVKPATHITTSAQCDTCHASTTTWATGTFNHVTAVPAVAGRCATCHNGTSALGKPSTHIPTTAQCDTCHNTFTAFAPAAMSHAGTTGPVATGNCATCHGGGYTTVNAQAKPATHIPTTQSCDTCHGTVAWKPTTFAHAGVVAGTCATCHNGTTALGKPATHLPTTASCDVCHTNYAAFAPAKMNHAGSTGPLTAGNCATCHSGTYLAINAQVKPATHVATTAQCDTCHKSTTSWATATFVHAVTDTNCSACHNGTTALGKPTTHIPTTAQCSVCHTNTVAFRPAAMNHAGTTGPLAAGNCSTCHNGSYVAVNALAKPTTHIPTTGQCTTCHSGSVFTAWSPATMNHTGLAGQCSTCHSGAYLAQNAQVKPVTHIPTTAQCDTCHSSTTTWPTGTFNHATATPAVAGRCSTCHNGTNALGKPSTHIPTTSQCDTCHRVFTAFAPATMTHTGLTGPAAAGNCSTCHGGAYVSVNALAKPATHIPTTSQCDVCHVTSAWKPTSFAHTGVAAGTCATCHNGVSAAGKPPVHIPTTRSCDDCHRMGVAWLPVITPYSHTGVAVGSCATCHISTYPSIDVKPATHLPTVAACDACHHSYAAWLPTTYTHTGVATGTCQTCHGGAYTGIMIKPSNHIPTVAPAGLPGNECSLCHSSTTSFTVERMNHGSVTTLCATCHDSAATYLVGSAQKINRSRHHSAGSKDCSSSGCHKPLGTLGRPYSAWN